MDKNIKIINLFKIFFYMQKYERDKIILEKEEITLDDNHLYEILFDSLKRAESTYEFYEICNNEFTNAKRENKLNEFCSALELIYEDISIRSFIVAPDYRPLWSKKEITSRLNTETKEKVFDWGQGFNY